MPYEFETETRQLTGGSNRLMFEAEPFEIEPAIGESEAAEFEGEAEVEARRGILTKSVSGGPVAPPIAPRERTEARLALPRRYTAAQQEVPLYEIHEEEAEGDLGELGELEIVPPTDSRKRVSNTKQIPYKWICTIVPTFRHPNTGREIEMTDQPGTGFLVGPCHVLTAAHVLFPSSGPLIHQSPIRVKVTPGHNSGSRPYGQYVSSTYKVRSEWRSGGRNTDNMTVDYAMIVLPRSIEQKGLKFWGASGTKTHRYPISRDWLKGKVVNVCGYPKDKTLYTMWSAHDVLDHPVAKRSGTALPNVFLHKADACVGQSGAPVWYYDGHSQRYLIGIHTGHCENMEGCSRQSGSGCMPGSSRWSHNRGVLLSHAVQEQINAWLR